MKSAVICSLPLQNTALGHYEASSAPFWVLVRVLACLVAAPCGGDEESRVDAGPHSHHEADGCEDCIHLHTIVLSQPGELLQEVHVPVGCLIGAQNERITCSAAILVSLASSSTFVWVPGHCAALMCGLRVPLARSSCHCLPMLSGGGDVRHRASACSEVGTECHAEHYTPPACWQTRHPRNHEPV